MLDQENQTISFYHILPDELSLCFLLWVFFFFMLLYTLYLSVEKTVFSKTTAVISCLRANTCDKLHTLACQGSKVVSALFRRPL